METAQPFHCALSASYTAGIKVANVGGLDNFTARFVWTIALINQPVCCNSKFSERRSGTRRR